MFVENTCDNCKYNVPDWTNKENNDHYCENEDSEYFGFNTDWVEDCDEWKEKGR